MTSREMQEAVEIELKQYDKDYESKNKLESREIFHFLSRYERDFIQEIYDQGIDKNEANKKKLGKLLSTISLTGANVVSSSFYPYSYEVAIPPELLYTINERADITISGVSINNVLVKPSSYDEYNVNKENPFRKSTKYKCLRLEGTDDHIVIVPATATLNRILLDYVKTPLGIDIDQDCELHVNTHYNIVKGAVKLILAAKQEQVGYQISSMEEKNK